VFDLVSNLLVCLLHCQSLLSSHAAHFLIVARPANAMLNGKALCRIKHNPFSKETEKGEREGGKHVDKKEGGKRHPMQ
jgi:hypothetical protein